MWLSDGQLLKGKVKEFKGNSIEKLRFVKESGERLKTDKRGFCFIPEVWDKFIEHSTPNYTNQSPV